MSTQERRLSKPVLIAIATVVLLVVSGGVYRILVAKKGAGTGTGATQSSPSDHSAPGSSTESGDTVGSTQGSDSSSKTKLGQDSASSVAGGSASGGSPSHPTSGKSADSTGATGTGHGGTLAVGTGGASSGGVSSGGVSSGGVSSGGLTPGATLPGAGSASSGTTSSPAGQTAAVEQNCFTVTYQHKATPGHSDLDACSQHRNLIRLKHEKVNLKSLCVRVDGVPVKFQAAPGKKGLTSVTIGPIAGPTAKISARYCLGKESCAEECKIPKDEFMEAIGGADEGTAAAKPGQMAQWDPSDNDKQADVAAELEADIQKELAGGNNGELSLFEGWTEQSQSPMACAAPDRKLAAAPVAPRQ